MTGPMHSHRSLRDDATKIAQQNHLGRDAPDPSTPEPACHERARDKEIDAGNKRLGRPVSFELLHAERAHHRTHEQEQSCDARGDDGEPLRRGVRGAGPVRQNAHEQSETAKHPNDAEREHPTQREHQFEARGKARRGDSDALAVGSSDLRPRRPVPHAPLASARGIGVPARGNCERRRQTHASSLP